MLSMKSSQRSNKTHNFLSVSALKRKKRVRKASCTTCISFPLLAVCAELFINPQCMICFSFMVLSTNIYILALPFAASQEAHLVYYHTTHGIKPLVKKWNLLHLELETLKTSLSHAPKNIKRNIFLCFSGIFTSSCERIKVAGLHFICSLFLNCLACHHRHGIVIKSHKKSYGLLNALFL